MPFLPPPPSQYALYQFTQFEWCQIQYVFARELTRDQRSDQQPLTWQQAYEEAGLVVAALKQGQAPMAYGARPDEVVWATMLCHASRYSHMSPENRQRARERMASGTPIWMIEAVIEEPDLCDRRVLEDQEYIPYPPCVPTKVTWAVRDTIASASWAAGVLLIAITFVDASRAMHRRRHAKSKPRKVAR